MFMLKPALKCEWVATFRGIAAAGLTCAWAAMFARVCGKGRRIDIRRPFLTKNGENDHGGMARGDGISHEDRKIHHGLESSSTSILGRNAR